MIYSVDMVLVGQQSVAPAIFQYVFFTVDTAAKPVYNRKQNKEIKYELKKTQQQQLNYTIYITFDRRHFFSYAFLFNSKRHTFHLH